MVISRFRLTRPAPRWAEQPRLALGLLDATAKLAGELDAPDLVALADRQAAALRDR